MTYRLICLIVCLGVMAQLNMGAVPSRAAELVTLSPDNYDAYAPAGKEADAIWGDYVLRNEHIVAAIADPRLITGRSASRWAIPTTRGVVIDLTTRNNPNDQLTAYYPAKVRYKPDAPNYQEEIISEREAHKQPGREPQKAKRVALDMPAYEVASGKMLEVLAALPKYLQGQPEPHIEVRYVLEDGWKYLRIETTWVNPSNQKAAFTPPLYNALRADGGNDLITVFDGALVIAWDKWTGQAYGVYSDELTRRATKNHQTQVNFNVTANDGRIQIQPGQRRTIATYLIPGRDAFEVMTIAAALANQPTRDITLQLAAPDGAVAHADVTAIIAGNVVGAGRTDDKGKLDCHLPAGAATLRITPFGRPMQTVDVPATSAQPVVVEFPAAGRVAANIVDEQGKPIPARVRFTGVGDTNDPDFAPETGDFALRNIVLADTGKFTQILPPGTYHATITRGPEYDPVDLNITVTPGQTTPINATLKHVVDTTGWISTDVHNHTTRSGRSDIFYVYPYSKDPTADGDSAADPVGRVRSLLAAGVEFAVATDHNFITSLKPYIDQIHAGDHLATAPGIGLTAGRRHTLNHQNVFPVTFVPGAQDGGVLQRPEHIGQLNWMLQWDDGAEKLVQIVQPGGDNFNVNSGMDMLDVINLQPLIEGKPLSRRDNRILDWIEKLQHGYRLPGAVNSKAYDNYRGAGDQRTYVKSPTDNPAEIKPHDVRKAMEAGHALMTTGPFMTVTAAAKTSPASEPVIMGSDLRADDGKVTLHIKVQANHATSINRLQVLVNGQRPARIDLPVNANSLQDEAAPSGNIKVQTSIDLNIDEDAFVIVIASGDGADPRSTAKPGNRRVHLAVSNPIWVDVAEEGYSPHSPLNDTVVPDLVFLEAPVARVGSEPGLIRMRLINRGTRPARDDVQLDIFPTDSAVVVGPNKQHYDLPHRSAETAIFWQIEFTEDYLKKNFPVISTYNSASRFGVRVPRSGKFPGRRGAGNFMHVDHHVGSLTPIAAAADVRQALESEMNYPVRPHRAGQAPLGQMRFAIAGDQLAVSADVTETKLQRHAIVWEGSCVELFACMTGRHPDNLDIKPGGWYPINQVYLAPAVGDKPATAFKRIDDVIVPAPEIQVVSRKTAAGYSLDALIPLTTVKVDPDQINRLVYFNGFADVSVFGLDARPGRFLLDARMNTVTSDNGDRNRGTIFRSNAPHVDSNAFGRMRPEGSVRARIEAIRPMSADGEAGLVRVTLKNVSKTVASDRTRLRVEPAEDAAVVGDDVVAYQLQPGEERSFEFEVKLASGASANFVSLVLPRSPKGEIVAVPSPRLAVADRALPNLGDLKSVDDVAGQLAELPAYEASIGKQTVMTVRHAIAGNDLAVMATIVESNVTQVAEKPWKGSSFEVFGSPAGSDKIGQVFLTPGADGKPALAMKSDAGRIQPANAIRVKSAPTDAGYEIYALIPLALLHIDDVGSQVKLEYQITTALPGGDRKTATMFGSARAYLNNVLYGRFRRE